ncbi:zinc dependent phospholipase C family protein [archaeon]|nr:zinc dependent phospholipase C family protein [archaeon]NCP79520.1 zinc dependent phospholipase C family protein [archaeon]NCP97463.1 zinc dependent phospholipase C family protein [archaeon]NCQ07287.1 zinc dependent phospholipase C family protein [archaeon]NCQ51083.1 zinc dependent phospholipase C family protein [archaeon]
MALQQTHVIFLKEIIELHPNLLKNYNKKSLYYGAVYPDIFYIRLLKTRPNFSLYLHENKNIIKIGEELYNNSSNISERSFSIGFLSHFFLDKRIHGYLEKIGFIDGPEHLSLEFYLYMFLDKKTKVSVSKNPNKLLKKIFKFYFNKQNYFFIPNILIKRLFLFVCNYIIKETIDIKYKKIKKGNFFKNNLLKISYYFAFNSYGYSVSKLFNPDFKFLEKHLPFLLKEYNLAKKDFIDFLNNGNFYG